MAPAKAMIMTLGLLMVGASAVIFPADRFKVPGDYILMQLAAVGGTNHTQDQKIASTFVPRCEHDADWHYVLDYSDRLETNDLPDDPNDIGPGFQNANAYYIGNTALQDLDIQSAEACFVASSQSCDVACVPITDSNAGNTTDSNWLSVLSMFDTPVKKIIAAFSGQFPYPASYSGAIFFEYSANPNCDSNGDYTTPAGCAWGSIPQFGNNCGSQSIGGHTGSGQWGSWGANWHLWGAGATMLVANTGADGLREVGHTADVYSGNQGYSNPCDNVGGFAGRYPIDTFQIRVRASSFPTAFSFAAGVAAVGDPHLRNIHGQRFDLMQPGVHSLVNIPRGSLQQEAMLYISARAEHLGHECADMYFTAVNVTGNWMKKSGLGALHFSTGPGNKGQASQWLQIGPISLKVVRGHLHDGVVYFNVYLKKLGNSGMAVGGLLGEDDHETQATPSANCMHTMKLHKIKSMDPTFDLRGPDDGVAQEGHPDGVNGERPGSIAEVLP